MIEKETPILERGCANCAWNYRYSKNEVCLREDRMWLPKGLCAFGGRGGMPVLICIGWNEKSHKAREGAIAEFLKEVEVECQE